MLKKIQTFLFKNQTARQTVAKNTFWLTVSNFGGRGIKAAIIIYAARALGTAEYGVFSYALTLAGFLGLFMEPGINTVLVREGARGSDEERRNVFSTSLILKIVLLAIGVSIVFLVGPRVSTLPGAALLMPIVAFIVMFDTLREFLSSLLTGLEKMEWVAATFLLTNVAIVALGFLFMFRSPTALSLGWGYALGTMVGAVAAFAATWDYVRETFTRFSTRLAKQIISFAWPFAIVGALGLLLTNMDILIISWMKTASDVGIYSASIRIIQVLYLLPGILQLSTLPLFSRLANKDDAKFRGVFERAVAMLFLISIPLAVGGFILGGQILSFVFGPAFAGGNWAFKLLAITLIVDYPGSLIVNAIFSYGHQKSLIVTSAIGGVSNVILDLLLIPRYGMTGSAVATLIAQTLSNGYLWYVMNGINPFSVFPRLKKILLASAIMGITTLILYFTHTGVVLNIGISIITYLIALKLLREELLAEARVSVSL